MRSFFLFFVLSVGLFLGGFVTESKAQAGTIVDTAIALNSSGPYAGQFDTLIAAVLAADPAVVNTLSGNGQFTVFAPTHAAFNALGLSPESVGELDQSGYLKVAGRFFSTTK